MSLSANNGTSVVYDPHDYTDQPYDEDIDGEMSGAERDLAEDAQWKRIQQNTFTRWANERLKTVNKSIGNLETDLSDGLRLITLIEVLSGKHLPKHNKRPVFRSQKLENVSVALKFLEDEEAIRIVNIDSSDIVDCKLKLILGLIWTLILHYSISMPMWEGEEDMENGDKGATPKQRLLHWIQSKISDLPIGNFTSDWNDGKAVGALVDAVAPGLCPDWQDWNPKDSLQNASEAMGLADDWLNVRQLIKPEELISPNMDELSMMTYLSQYPSAKLKPGAPLRPRRNPNSVPPPRVRAYGPGIEPTGLVAGARADFTVETISAGKGQVDVFVTNPNGQQEPVDIRFNNDRNLTYSVSYTPRLEGNHKVQVKFAGRDIPKSPYHVSVEGRAGDPTKVKAFGPGLNPDGNMIHRRTYFDISMKDTEKGVPEVIILDPSGNKCSVPVESCQISPDLWRCEYMPTTIGLHSVNVFFSGQHIPNSPFGVRVSAASDAKKVKASGRGLQPAGVRVRDVADFKIFTDGAGEGTPEVRVIGPGGINEPVKIRKIDGTTYEATYHPRKEGRHVVMITFAGQEIPRSPLEVNVGPFKDTKIRAYGPGLAGGVIGYPASFTVETNGETGALGFSIEGPSQAKIECHDNGDGSAEVRYYPTAAGEYAVHILCDNEDIPKSPYMAQILPHTDYYPDRVECSGAGIEPVGVVTGKPAQFKVDTRRAGNAPLDVQVLDGNSNNVDVSLIDNRDGTFSCSYLPKKSSKHIVQVNYGGVATKKSPYRVTVSEPVNVNNVRIYGPGIEKGVKANAPTHFNVDCRDAGEGDIHLSLTNEKKMEVPVNVSEVGNGIYVVNYAPTEPGNYSLNLSYGGLQVPQCPIKIPVSPAVDVSKIRVEGLEKTAPINSLQQFRVLTQGAGKAEFGIVITSPSRNRVKPHVVPTHEGYLVSFTPTELGEYMLRITLGGEQVCPTPLTFVCTYGSDPNKVRATGPGLERGMTRKPAEFIIDTRGAGQGGLGVTVEGPCEAAINCRDNGDGTCSVAYLPTEPGDYTINIHFNEQHVPGSPFQATIISELDSRRIKVSGNGIQPHGVHIGMPADIIVDPRAIQNRDDGKIVCKITNPSGARTENVVTPLGDGTYKIKYTPFEEGRHTIDIFYDGSLLSGSPFVVNVKRSSMPMKCHAFGPGLEKGIVNKSNEFTVDIKDAGNGSLDLFVEGPSEAKVTCKKNQDGSCTVSYVPYGPGNYDVGIKFSNQHIPGSPFLVPVIMEPDANAVRAFGPGIEQDKCRSGIPVSFTVDASESAMGSLQVNITSDRGPLTQKPDVKDNGDGTYIVTYTPPSEGTNLETRITYDNKDIPNSPFHIKVRPRVEPERVKLEGRGVSGKGIPASLPAEFTIDASDAGYGDLQVQVLGPDGSPKKVKVVDKGDGIFKATYTPDDCGKYKISVKYGDKEIPHSPVSVEAIAAGRAENCRITEGIQRNLTSGEEYCITVNTENAGYGALTCTVRSSSGSDLDVDIEDNGDKTYSIYYTVQDAGDYTINIKFGGELVPGGCYKFTEKNTFLHERLPVPKVENDIPTKQSADPPSARTPTTHINAEPEDFFKSSQVRDTHASKKSFNQTTTSSSVATFKKEFRQVDLHNIPLPSTGGLVTAEVKMPSGNVDKPIIEDNRDGTVSIKYGPKEEGLHELYIKYDGEHVQGSPFKFHVDCLSSGYVTAYGPGLSHGVAGEPSNFTISTKGAGAGGLTMAVEGPSKADISCHDYKDGTVAVSYLPTAPGEYKISVKFGDKHIKGSPYSAKITGEGRKRNQISVGSCSEVSLPGKVSDTEIRSLNASIQAPSGLEEPCFLKRLPNGNLGVSFTPREVGEHQVSVKKMGKHITNSPFKIKVADKEVGDAKKVQVKGALKEGVTHKDNIFTVDTRNAGYGGLSLSIEGPSKADIACKDNEDGTLNIAYKPTEPGFYIVNLKFADHHVAGSPFTVKVTGEGSNRVREKIQRQREAVPVTEVGSRCKLTFKMPGITAFDLSSSVTSPGGVTEDAELNEIEDGLYAVHFVPKELGVHTVCVKYKDIHIPGSPFQFTVGPLKDGGAHRVHAGGPGLERGEQGQPCEFNVWTREAGAGSLAISVEGPSKAQIDFKDRKDGSCYVSYVVGQPGEYRIGIKFNDQHIPDSPYKVYISPAMGDAHKLEVAQFPESGVRANHPSSFLVRKNGAKGELDCKIVSPSGIEDDCFSQSIDSDTYAVRFMPRENGIHNIHCKFNGVHIPGSPFRIKVGKEDADPAAVRASGNGLNEIKTGAKTDFIVDTCSAGAGTLAVTVDGPSKVSMDCTEVEEGYKVRYTPLVPGDYYVSVKYNGYHIVGSPFKVNCKGEDLAERGAQETSSVVVETVHKVAKSSKQVPTLPKFKSDASKVTSKGMGLKKAYLQKQNMFTVHCGDAGNNILYVGMYGPKGPCDEIFVKHLGRNNFQVNYVVRDRGEYIVIVRWGDEHIPGSPFKVDV